MTEVAVVVVKAMVILAVVVLGFPECGASPPVASLVVPDLSPRRAPRRPLRHRRKPLLIVVVVVVVVIVVVVVAFLGNVHVSSRFELCHESLFVREQHQSWDVVTIHRHYCSRLYTVVLGNILKSIVLSCLHIVHRWCLLR